MDFIDYDSEGDLDDSGYGSEIDPDEDIHEALQLEPDSDSELERILREDHRPTGSTVPYSEPQSVHTFMGDTRELVIWLVKEYPLENFPYKPPFNHWLFDYCERTFDLVFDNQYRLIEILNAVLHYIRQSPHKNELYKILTDEADFNKDVCVSGHITFIVNAIRGFPGVPAFEGQVFEHRRQQVYHHLNKTLDFTYPDRIATQIKGQVDVLLALDCPISDLLNILIKYTGVTWIIDNGKLDVKLIQPIRS